MGIQQETSGVVFDCCCRGVWLIEPLNQPQPAQAGVVILGEAGCEVLFFFPKSPYQPRCLNHLGTNLKRKQSMPEFIYFQATSIHKGGEI